jgi:hypothetical protein
MIVLKINGKRTEITGWRAWLVYAAATLVLLLLFAFLLIVFIGFSLTLGVALLIIIPAVGVVALVSAMLQQNK